MEGDVRALERLEELGGVGEAVRAGDRHFGEHGLGGGRGAGRGARGDDGRGERLAGHLRGGGGVAGGAARRHEHAALEVLFLALLLADRDGVVLALLAERLGVEDAADTAPRRLAHGGFTHTHTHTQKEGKREREREKRSQSKDHTKESESERKRIWRSDVLRKGIGET